MSRRRLTLLDLFSEFNQAGLAGVPLVGLLAGLGGSLHCIGMCGAFATSCSQKSSGLALYNSGRLTSYTIMGLLSGLLGASFTYLFKDPWISALPAIILGAFFLFWGYNSWRGKSTALKLPHFLRNQINQSIGKIYIMKSKHLRSFFLGFFSVFLPCGLLYGVILALAAFQDPFMGALGMLSFGLGTLPAMAIAPTAIIKIIKPIKEHWPRLTSLSLISLGLITIIYRMVIAYEQASCH
jgi:uncharacterized protein